MNYTTLTIDDKKIGIKFGMASFRYLSEKFSTGIGFENNELNEIGIAHILYSGYYNNCLIKEVVPEYNLEFFVDTIEKNLKNESFLTQIQEIVKLWTENEFIKETQKGDQPKKKSTRGKK
jgi:hypothetical protein